MIFTKSSPLYWEAGRWWNDKCRHNVWYFQVQPTYWKQGPENLNNLSKKVLLFAVEGGPCSLVPCLLDQHIVPSQMQVPLLDAPSSVLWVVLGKNEHDSAPASRTREMAFLSLYIFTSLKVRAACTTFTLRFGSFSCDISPGPSMLGWVSRKAWNQERDWATGRTRGLDLVTSLF